MKYFINSEYLTVHSIMAVSYESSCATAGFSVVARPPSM